jgi:hypothetical protein
MTIEAGVVLALIIAICGVAFRLGALSQKVDGLTAAQVKSEVEQASTVTKLANLHSDVRIIVSRVNEILHAQKRGKVYMLDQREDT